MFWRSELIGDDNSQYLHISLAVRTADWLVVVVAIIRTDANWMPLLVSNARGSISALSAVTLLCSVLNTTSALVRLHGELLPETSQLKENAVVPVEVRQWMWLSHYGHDRWASD